MSTHPTAAISIADGEITIDAELLASNALFRAMGDTFSRGEGLHSRIACKIARNFDPIPKSAQRIDFVTKDWN
jgi:hypothetical protein